MQKIKYGRRFLQIGMLLFLFLLCDRKVYAAFPGDLNEKSMKAYALTESVDVFSDSSLSGRSQQMDGTGFVLNATDVSDDQKALYGSYRNDAGQTGEGWIAASVFRVDENYEDVYYTVRSALTIYTNSQLSEKRASIKKYSGIIAIGKKNGAVQVIYETKDGYGIGWMDEDSYEPKLYYDGRDKQVLADGSYTFTTLTDVKLAEDTVSSKTFRLEYISKKMYRIFDLEQNQYLKIQTAALEEEATSQEEKPDWMESGWKHTLKKFFDSSYREKVEAWEEEQVQKEEEREEQQAKIQAGEIYQDPSSNMIYEVTGTENPQEAEHFLLSRNEDYFTISSASSGLYLRFADGLLCLTDEEYLGENDFFQVRAAESMINTTDPMVFTQYDAQWCGNAYGSEGCIGTAGCGILATVNAVYALTGQYMSVMELADYAVETGLRIEGSGTDDGIFKAAAEKYGSRYGFAYDGQSERMKTLKKKLGQGDVATVHVIGHYVSIVAYDTEKDQFLLLDSNWLPKRETTAFGDWIAPSRLQDGYLYGQMYYFFRQAE